MSTCLVSPSSTSASASAPSPLRVLTVGDGNLSFSLALHRLHEPSKRERRRQQSRPHSIQSTPLLPPLLLTSSVFDSEAAEVSRYPECRSTVQELRRRGVELLFHIDATDLRRTVDDERRRQSTQSSLSPPSPPFDVLFFHQPHCGREDVQRHRALLSHFFYSALSVTHLHSLLVVTLCNRQPLQWQLDGRSRSMGWTVERRRRWEGEMTKWEALGYQNRRHHTGRQFNAEKIGARHHFVLSRREQSTAALQPPATLHLQWLLRIAGDDGEGEEQKEGEKEEEEEQADDEDEEDPHPLSPSSSPLCPVCVLPVSAVHPSSGEYGVSVFRVPPVDPSASELRCPDCRASFQEERALQQHRITWKDREDHSLHWEDGEGKRRRQSRLIAQGRLTEAIEQRVERRRQRKEARHARRTEKEGEVDEEKQRLECGQRITPAIQLPTT